MSIEAVLFDFAGVLVSSPWPAMREAGGGSLELLIGPYDEDTDHPWHRVERGEIPISEWAVEVTRRGEEVGVTVDFAPLRSLLGEMDVHTVVVDRVVSLRAEGFKTALITNNVAEASGTWRTIVAVDELFDVVVDSSAVGMRKPSPEIFEHALTELGGVAPDRAVFLDDTEGNVEGARRAGLHAILVDDPTAAIDELDRLLPRQQLSKVVKPFAFDRSWRFPVPPTEVWATIGDVEQYPKWWPWLRTFDTGGGGLATGTSARCAVRGPLPYQLSFTVTLEEVEPELLVAAHVAGDLNGPARLELTPDGEATLARIVWSVELRDPVLRAAARVARPLMEWGHDWVVDNGVRQFERDALAR